MSSVPASLQESLADRYRLERELGQGGMATVYLAHDLRHDRDVALKVLRPELAAILGRERFLAEIRLTAKLDHPHILTLLDSGESNGLLWYTLPFIRGESLRQKLTRERQLGVAESVGIARQIAGALDYAHQHGVIHRDVKPENILLHEGEAMLADFGIALAVREAGGPRLTETGLSIGTPQYMSPEQATAERQLDARSDVYSLGAVLYEMLAGEPPFTGVTGQAVIAKLMVERPDPAPHGARRGAGGPGRSGAAGAGQGAGGPVPQCRGVRRGARGAGRAPGAAAGAEAGAAHGGPGHRGGCRRRRVARAWDAFGRATRRGCGPHPHADHLHRQRRGSRDLARWGATGVRAAVPAARRLTAATRWSSRTSHRGSAGPCPAGSTAAACTR